MSDSYCSYSGCELGLSNCGQMELLRGMTERGAPLRTRVRGGSMAPFIRDKDVLTIAPVNEKAPGVGDVVAFSLPGTGKLAIHRVVDITAEGWCMRGDSGMQADGIVSRGDILGRVTRVERAGKVIRLGMGAEGRVISWLSRKGLITGARALLSLPRQVAASVARGLQSISLYRAMAVRLRPFVIIVEADDEDLAKVQRYLNPRGLIHPTGTDSSATNYVAKRGATVVGFVQFVRHPEAHFPWGGQWLFSLTVWRLYRGMGIGEMLTQHVIERAAADGAPELLLAIFQDNARAICLYRKLGFERILQPSLELELEAEERQTGRRRIIMRKKFTG